jgi:hypothetical protein
MTMTIGLDPSGTLFTLDGKPEFLLGFSYYGALGAPDDFVDRDVGEMRELGFNWFRVWATWAAFENNVSAVDSDGNAREPYLSKLKSLCEKADALGMVVDVTFSTGNGVVGISLDPRPDACLNAVANVTRELLPFRNVYIDVANERNIKDRRHVPLDEIGVLRDRVKEIDPERLVTASHSGEIPDDEVEEYVNVARVDFLSPHRPRNTDSPSQTADKTGEYLAMARKAGRAMPVHYQEPFRRDFGKYQPGDDDFLVDLRNAERGGAAGWCFHNGDARSKSDGRPRRSFDLRAEEGRLFDQLDEDELKVVRKAASVLTGRET